MKGQVTKLCDAASIQIPAEMLTVSVDKEQVENEVRQLSMSYAKQEQVPDVCCGDIVTCKDAQGAYADGRSVMLYTGLNIPGGQEAAKAAIGKQVGDTFATTLADKPVSLTVEKIIRLTPAQVNDGLIASLNIPDVTTVDAYRQYAENMLKNRQAGEKRKMAVGYVMEKTLEASEFAYDQAEMDAYFAAHMDEIMAEYKEFGMEGTEEDIRHDVTQQLKQGWMAEEMCKRSGYELDMAEVEQETDQMLEMMSLMGETAPDRETLVEESIRNAYVMEMFKQLETVVDGKMGG